MTTLNPHGHWNNIGNDGLNDLTPEEIAELRAQALRSTFRIVLAAGVVAALWWS
ncbi:hypothetical protein [Microvirga massiliensis]|uniref:hypothetical protein n=1 Tax=Microvirga massiliensis TaxID=1033741 RepID=UPI000B1F87CD|nr:hypothetical protein [Microvirga massiliensis]